MTWIIFAFLGAFFWALVHHLDKLLLTKFAAQYGVGSVVIFSSLFPALILPAIFFLNPGVLSIPAPTIVTLMGAGFLGAIAAFFYFRALEKEEATVVVSMYQLSPVFGYILGLAFLGEHLSNSQILGAIITILGVTILSFEVLEEGKVRLRGRTSRLMIIAAFTYALGDVIYKDATVGNTSYLTAMFWIFIGYIIFGIGALSVREYRRNFLAVIQRKSGAVLGLNVLNECLQTAGLMFTAYALLLAPVALVLVMDSYQPVLVFILGILFTLFIPSLATEKISMDHLLHKATAIAVAILGTVLMQWH